MPDTKRDLQIIFAECLATEMDQDMTPEFVAACDLILIRLWIEGVKLARLPDEELADVS